MNANDLHLLFARQQKRRQAAMASFRKAPAAKKEMQKTKTYRSMVVPLIFLVMLLAIVLVMTVPGTPEPAPEQTLPQATQAARILVVTATATEVQFVIDRQVCTNVPSGNLHVRFAPNGSVRGYLAEGESVKLSTDSYTGDIEVQDRGDGTPWIHLQSPIEGWVNARYICYIEGEEKHDREH